MGPSGDKLQLAADEYDVSAREKLVFSAQVFKQNEPQPTLTLQHHLAE
jgi:hypothetical protein